MMILFSNIGNTHIHLGVYQDDDLVNSWRLRSDKTKTEDESNIDRKDIFRVIISSAVPEITKLLKVILLLLPQVAYLNLWLIKLKTLTSLTRILLLKV
ncbi:MAG: type III pantothenate kinase [Candidatus Cloacimonadota bacterium]|nr:type III pantothenate kinase [Candidatus Cloacimonadota bacterium]